MEYPRKLTPTDANQELLDLIARLMPLLLAGDHPTCGILRDQYARAQILEITLTGTGFFADFEIPSDAPRTEQNSMSGGDVCIALEGVENGAGCVLFVTDGAIATLEGYANGPDGWPERPVVLALEYPCPLMPVKTLAAGARDTRRQ
jgi:hypothetical protein